MSAATQPTRDESPAMPSPGDSAPDFHGADQEGKEWSLADFRGKWLLLYFYPKDDTPGCTTEACGLRDNFGGLRKAGCAVVGVSTDTVKSHAKFAQKYDLPFTLLADPEGAIIEAYGVRRWKSFMGKSFLGTMRVSFLIDPNGSIAKVYPSVSPKEHAGEILADLHALGG